MPDFRSLDLLSVTEAAHTLAFIRVLMASGDFSHQNSPHLATTRNPLLEHPAACGGCLHKRSASFAALARVKSTGNSGFAAPARGYLGAQACLSSCARLDGSDQV